MDALRVSGYLLRFWVSMGRTRGRRYVEQVCHSAPKKTALARPPRAGRRDAGEAAHVAAPLKSPPAYDDRWEEGGAQATPLGSQIPV